MSLFIASLNSGSNGNCYYIGNQQEAVLIDAGISCRETERRMERIGLSLKKVKAIFISHEHTDHTRGVEVIAKKYKLPVYITPDTHRNSRLRVNQKQLNPFFAYTPVYVGALRINAFPKWHDAAEPHSFTVSDNGITIGVFTDLGIACEHVVEHFKQCNAAFLESNYDEKMLEEGSYPYYLKQRIRGVNGHLSNEQALELFTNHRSSSLSHLLLSHLSEYNNKPELVHDLFSKNAGGSHIAIASRHQESEVFCITG